MKKSLILRLLCCGALLVGFSTGAFAQATRTWVSGVGDDANPCSRTAPCKTFAGAISKTQANGEINVLDPGGFGGVTITKPITISSECFEAGVLVSGTNAIVVSVPNASDVVVLRGLDIEGLTTGLSGISVVTGGTVQVEKCTINHFTVSGINVTTTVTNSKLNVLDTIIRNNGNFGAASGQGTFVNPSAASTAHFNNVRWENNVAGLKVQGNSKNSASNCVAGDNAFAGFSAATSPAVLNVENSVSTHNGTGIVAVPGTNVRLGNNSITDNGAPLGGGGTVFSFKNNDFDVAAAVTPINPQ